MPSAFTIAVAGQCVRIEPLTDRPAARCRAFLCSDRPDFTVSLRPEDLNRERAIAEGSGLPEAELEFSAISRKLTEALLACDTLLFHASALSFDGEGYLFTALSGTGKSTHSRLWREVYGDHVTMVNDDKPFLRLSGDEVLVCGSPWNGKHRLSANLQVPVRGICLLNRASENSICPISARDAFPALLQQSYRPKDPLLMHRTLSILEQICRRVPFYTLGCNMEPDAAITACAGLRGNIE